MTWSPDALLPFAVLLAGHFLADFVLRPATRAPRRDRLSRLLAHALLHGALAFLLLGVWSAWVAPGIVFLSHTFIDGVKNRWCQDTARNFVIDQTAHIAVLFGLSVWLSTGSPSWPADSVWFRSPWSLDSSLYAATLALLAGFVATVEAGAQLIARLVRPYLEELEQALRNGESGTLRPARGLTHAGKVIGRLERALVFLLVLVGQPAAIGFLVAAKSIFRFGELKETANRMESEYIIIGTLASFGYAVAMANATQWLVNSIR